MTRRTAGFTLIELLVAVSIFAIMSVLSYGGLRHLLSLEHGLQAAAGRYDRLEFAAIMLETDFKELRARSVRDALGEPEPALRAGLAGELLSLTRHVSPVPGGETDAVALRRVRYRLEEGQLYRDVWSALDRTPVTAFTTRRLLTGVEGLAVRFFAGGTWQDSWPPGSVGTSTATAGALPDGIEFRFDLGSGRYLRRLVVRAQ